jgi:hypothetical protein
VAIAWPGTNKVTIAGYGECGECSGVIWHPRIDRWIFVEDGGHIYSQEHDTGDLTRTTTFLAANPGADLEGICYPAPASNFVYLLNEGSQLVYEVYIQAILDGDNEDGIENGATGLRRTFNLGAVVDMENAGAGPEGITFIPSVAGIDSAAVIAEGGCFAVGTQLDGKVRYFLLPIVTSSVDTTVTHLTDPPYNSPAGPVHGGWTDVADLEYDRARRRLFWQLDSNATLVLTTPFPAVGGAVTILGEISEPDNSLPYEAFAIDDENHRASWGCDDQTAGYLYAWDVDFATIFNWEIVGTCTSPACTSAGALTAGRNITGACTCPAATSSGVMTVTGDIPWPGTHQIDLYTTQTECYESSGIIYHPVLDKWFWVDDGGSTFGDGTSYGRIYMCDTGGGNKKWWSIGNLVNSKDLEDICFADPASDFIYLVNESSMDGTASNCGVYQMSLTALLAAASGTAVAATKSWNLTALLNINVGWNGPEGLTFIPLGGYSYGGVFVLGSQTDGRAYYVELLADGTSRRVTEGPCYDYAAHPSVGGIDEHDLGALDYDRTWHRLIWLFDSNSTIYLTHPFPLADHSIYVTATIEEPGVALSFEGIGIDEVNGRVGMCEDLSGVSVWDMDWENIGNEIIVGTGTAPVCTSAGALTAGRNIVGACVCPSSGATSAGILFAGVGPVLVVITDAVAAITRYSATLNGRITDDGGLPILACGVCIATHTLPRLSGALILPLSSDWGLMPVTMVCFASGLAAGTHYYIRAYATTAAGTAFGAEVEFDTLAETNSTRHPGAIVAMAIASIQRRRR